MAHDLHAPVRQSTSALSGGGRSEDRARLDPPFGARDGVPKRAAAQQLRITIAFVVEPFLQSTTVARKKENISKQRRKHFTLGFFGVL